MNKTKLILAGIGGASGLVALVLGFFVWQEFSARTAAVESNRTVLTEWTAAARKGAAAGDRIFGETTPAAFKAFMVGNVAILRNPTNATSRILKPDFAFGPFKEYIAEGKLPEEGELAVLQRRWDDVVTVVELLGASGITELTDVQFKAAAKDAAAAGKDKKDAKSKKDRRKASKSSNPTIQQSDNSFTYVFAFAARPAAFAKAVNALETCERFVVVEDFSFSRPVDAILEALAGDEKKDAAQSAAGRRGRRNRRSGEAESLPLQGKTDAASKSGVVTDPLLDAPMSVVMTVTVHDFRSLEDSGEAVHAADSGTSGRDSASPLEKGISK